MIHRIRPHEIFSRLQDSEITLTIPSEPAGENRSVMLLEIALLIASARITNSQRILEIGTCYGYTSLHLARNVEDSLITTVDIERHPVRAYDREPESGQITEIISSSRSLPVRSYDMIFIDGDHATEGISADTRYAFRCSPEVIAWHDYGNDAEEPDVRPFLDGLSERYDLYHVVDSWLVFWFKEGLK